MTPTKIPLGSNGKKEFILQGFTTSTHANALRSLFTISDIQRVILSVAFVSESGVQQIEKELKMNAEHVTVFAGIRNEITSYQGLVRLNAIGGKLFTVDTGCRSIIFHPKLYLVRGHSQAKLIIGSANLTLGGLNNNIEAGMLLDFDLTDASNKSVVDEIETLIDTLPKDYSEHVVQVSSIAILDKMLACGRLTDEMAIPPPRPATSVKGSGESDTIPRIKLKVIALRKAIEKAKVVSKTQKVPVVAKPATPSFAPTPRTLGIELELVWESKPLVSYQ